MSILYISNLKRYDTIIDFFDTLIFPFDTGFWYGINYRILVLIPTPDFIVFLCTFQMERVVILTQRIS